MAYRTLQTFLSSATYGTVYTQSVQIQIRIFIMVSSPFITMINIQNSCDRD